MHDLSAVPLNLGAVPRELIPLHIFEERFKTTSKYLRDEFSFGIVTRERRTTLAD